METVQDPNKFEKMVTSLYAQINAIGLQAKNECYEILSKNPKGNCVLINPDNEDLIIKDGEEDWIDYPYLGIGKKPFKHTKPSEDYIEKIIGG